MKLIDHDGTEVKLVRYYGSEVSALYKNGKLLFASDHEMVDARISFLCNVDVRHNNNFLMGKEARIPGFSGDVAQTVEEADEFARNRHHDFLAEQRANQHEADELRKQAAELLRRADEISPVY